MLSGKSIVMGVTGGIAAYKAVDLASRLIKRGAQIDVIMTKHAQEFVRPLTFSSIVGSAVVADQFAPPTRYDVEHVALAKKADLFVIAPATANCIGKIAAGIADDSLTTTVMATRAPVLICPAMNTQMYLNPITQRNIAALRDLGYLFVDPASGRLACGDVGVGKLADVELIEERIVFELLRDQTLSGKKVLVTAGPTSEPLDPVRSITNRSSGKMGYAFAAEAARMGADVVLVSGPTALKTPFGVRRVDVKTTLQMLTACEQEADADVVIMAAAPADFRPASVSTGKIKKQDGQSVTLELIQNPDILRTLGEKKRPGQLLIGFAAETENLLEHARKKRVRKHADYIVANDVSRPGVGFDGDTNAIVLISESEETEFGLDAKPAIARRVLEHIFASR